MAHEMKYEDWFIVHSGVQKPEKKEEKKEEKKVTLTKGGFLSSIQSKLNTAAKKPVEKGKTPYEKWFYRNCDNNNVPDLAEINSHDYEAWFLRHSTKRAPEPKYSSPYEAWFFRNCDNRNPGITKVDEEHIDYPTWFERHSIKRAPEPKYSSPYEAWFFRNCDNRNLPDLSKLNDHDYPTWFKKHSTKTAPQPVDKSYEAWFERNCDSKNPGVMPQPVLTYEQWFGKHSTPSLPVKCECVKHEPYEEWFKRHSK